MTRNMVAGAMVTPRADKGSVDWQDNAAARARPFGVPGVVVEVATGHGACYRVLLLDGSTHWYEHDELTETSR
jgi:hypothetical protein